MRKLFACTFYGQGAKKRKVRTFCTNPSLSDLVYVGSQQWYGKY